MLTVKKHKGVEPKIGGVSPKMDGENNGKHMENPIKMDDLGVPLFLEIPTNLQEKLMMCFPKHPDPSGSSRIDGRTIPSPE